MSMTIDADVSSSFIDDYFNKFNVTVPVWTYFNFVQSLVLLSFFVGLQIDQPP
jgi:hypothetical protein